MGLPGAGKTALANALAERVTARIVSRDVIRLAMFEPCSFTHEEKMAAFDATLIAIATNWQLGHLTIAEGMPFSRTGEFEAVNDVLAAQGGRAAPLFLEVDPETASERIAEQRAASVPMADDRDTSLAHEVLQRFRPLPPGTHVLDATLAEAEVLQHALGWLQSERESLST
jgi:predicted kinase